MPPPTPKRPLTPRAALSLARSVEVVDLRFTDLLGTQQHFSIPADSLSPDSFKQGLGFDGSSIRGFQSIEESDLLLRPVPATASIDGLRAHPTLALTCDVWDPITQKAYPRDPRFVARKAEARLLASGIADVSYWGPEAEFYIFDSLRFDANAHEGYYHIDSREGIWESGRQGPNAAYRPRHQEGYFPTPPTDKFQDLRSEIMLNLLQVGVPVEVQHHEVGSAGQAEIDLHYDSLVAMADSLMTYKYIVKNVAASHGLVATFMPKPLYGDNGSGMHIHQSLWKGSRNLFAGKGYAGLSPLALHYIAGLLAHAPSLLAFCAPTTNSYRRLVPGFEAPVNLAYSRRNRSAAIRIPMYSTDPKTKRVEFRCPDPAANPYLAFAACLQAGLDGIIRRLPVPPPVDADIYTLDAASRATIATVPGSLEQSLDALEKDHDFLLAGGVFTPDLISTWLDWKRTQEIPAVSGRPHPYEFMLYSDA